ncbi:MAG: nucleoid-associated protein [Bacteroidales bacterium]|jgi:hypothetical protein|nr:nucleoid-associated protein [Bacteroidales bacterium]
MDISENTMLSKIAIHFIGNKHEEESLQESRELFQPEEELSNSLLKYFLSSFKGESFYTFLMEDLHAETKMLDIIENIFENSDSLLENSVKLACHLYEQSSHPKVKSGEFYVVYFENCQINGEEVEAIGLFKTEVKDPFLKVKMVDDHYEAFTDKGISLQKIDKGCLIYNHNKEEGYLIEMVDNTGKGSDAQYWKEDFLQLRPRQDEYFNTNHYLSMCKSFITEELPEQYEISKTDQIALLNRSVGYFKENKDFDIDHFEKKVIGNPEVIQEFNNFKETYQQEKEVVLEDKFAISNSAVKKQNRIFRSVIKLDKNFHIYVHGNNELIEQGVDEKGRKYYKIYYTEEN